MRVLVAGASGYVGSRLVPELLARGHEVVATHTRDQRPAFPWAAGVPEVTWRRADALDVRQLVRALRECDAAVYLVHGLKEMDFATTDREAAENMRDAVDHLGVPRLVYLSGIIPRVHPDDLSEHLSSRLEVEEILATSHAATLALRAAVVVGSGSTSFEVIRQLSERMPLVTPVPGTMRSTRVQPVAVADAVYYLAEAVEHPEVTGHLDVGGPEVLGYPQLLARYARVSGLRRVQVPVPSLPPDLVGWLAGRLTDVDTDTVQSLMASLRDDMVARTAVGPRLGDPHHALVPLDEALARALVPYAAETDGAGAGADPAAPSAGDPEWTWRGRGIGPR